MLLSMSRQRTLAYLDHLGKNHDAEVIEWKETLENSMNSPHEVYASNFTYNIIV